MTEEVKEVDTNSAKEQASKFIGKYGLGVVLVLVLAGIYAAGSLEAGTLAVVMSMISTVVMAVIGIPMAMLMAMLEGEDSEV